MTIDFEELGRCFQSDVLEGARVAKPSQDSFLRGLIDPSHKAHSFKNFRYVPNKDDSNKLDVVGLEIYEIAEALREQSGGWPKRVGRSLFVPGGNDLPLWFESAKAATQLFAWIDGQLKVNWKTGSDKVSQDRFYAYLQMDSEAFDVVESYPHWPPNPGAYYMYPELPESDGSYLEELLDCFSPATLRDRQLIKAFILTLVWGGPPGSRPAWVFIGPRVDDDRNRRGVGKSKLVEMLSGLVGGFMSCSVRDKIQDITKRLLSPKARSIRVALLDNVKTHRFSWGDLEALITSPVISGHEMYKGEGRRPNTVLWAITLNGGKLSKDMAQRSMIVRVARPAYSGDWEAETRTFIEEHRWHILSDAVQLLRSRMD